MILFPQDENEEVKLPLENEIDEDHWIYPELIDNTNTFESSLELEVPEHLKL